MKRSRRRCRHCRHIFRPDPRLKERQHYCSSLSCQTYRQRLNEQDWLKRHPECLAYKRQKVREWFQAHPRYSAKRRQKSPALGRRNRIQSRHRMRKLRSKRRFDKTKSILTELVEGKGDKCYLTRASGWLHLRLTNPSRWRKGRALWENAGRLKPEAVEFKRARVYDLSQAVFSRAP